MRDWNREQCFEYEKHLVADNKMRLAYAGVR